MVSTTSVVSVIGKSNVEGKELLADVLSRARAAVVSRGCDRSDTFIKTPGATHPLHQINNVAVVSLSFLNSTTAPDGFSCELTKARSRTLEAHSTTLKGICLGNFVEHLKCTFLRLLYLSIIIEYAQDESEVTMCHDGHPSKLDRLETISKAAIGKYCFSFKKRGWLFKYCFLQQHVVVLQNLYGNGTLSFKEKIILYGRGSGTESVCSGVCVSKDRTCAKYGSSRVSMVSFVQVHANEEE
ncbi:hypothetical protein L1887_25716 [Cichorium endivia]|nr:hypothetical protein L1887_25716 [Cichorium endivia]